MSTRQRLAALVTVLAIIIVVIAFVRNYRECEVYRFTLCNRADMRSIGTSLESYYMGHQAYPPWIAPEGSEQRPGSHPTAVPSLAARCLTTPMAYMSSVPMVYGMTPDCVMGYYTLQSGDAAGWVMWCPGPDQKYNLDWKLYDPTLPADRLRRVLAPYTYDPTNGVVSAGDIWRAKQVSD